MLERSKSAKGEHSTDLCSNVQNTSTTRNTTEPATIVHALAQEWMTVVWIGLLFDDGRLRSTDIWRKKDSQAFLYRHSSVTVMMKSSI